MDSFDLDSIAFTLDLFVLFYPPSFIVDVVSFFFFFFFFLRNKLTAKHTRTRLITPSHQIQTHYFTQSTTTKKAKLL